MIKLKNSKGDTIVEVMIALAVLGLAFAISYATANHALNVSQNSNEHSKASQILNSQVEMAHTMAADDAVYSHKQTAAGGDGKWFCFYLDNVSKDVKMQAFDAIDNFNPDTQGNQFPANCTSPVNSQVNYYVYATLTVLGDASTNVNQNYFKFNIAWTGLGDLGAQAEQVSYKFNKLESFASVGDSGTGDPTCSAGFSGTWPDCKPISCLGGQVGTPPNCYDPATFRFVVKSVPLLAGSDPSVDRTPSCSSDPTGNRQGTTTSAVGPMTAKGSTDSSSTSVLGNLTPGSYTLSITPPTSYAACGPASESLYLNEGQTINVSGFYIRPVCSPYQVVVSTTTTYDYLYTTQVWNPYKYYGVIGGYWVYPKHLERMPPHGYWAWVYDTPYYVTVYGYYGGYDYYSVYGWRTHNVYGTRYNCPS